MRMLVIIFYFTKITWRLWGLNNSYFTVLRLELNRHCWVLKINENSIIVV